MSISLGGLGIMSLRNPLGEWAGFVYAKGDLRSVFCIVVFSIVFLVLAYLTNPSENSFRAYLTEQSFRHHLSRLDDTSDEQDTRDKVGSSQRRGTPPSSTHVFHSFGIFTVAAIIPARVDRGRPRRDRDSSTIVTDSWFIGAFGKWYRGGVLDAWYQDVVARSSDEESWTSGILGMKALDKLNEYDVLATAPGSEFNATPTSEICLVASAHTSAFTGRTSACFAAECLSQPLAAEQVHLGSPILSRSPSTIFDQSPRIVEVLHQISLSSDSVQDLRNQLADFQTSSSASHASLQTEVDSFRDRKRQEDASRSELKSRTKTLDDSKRAAESIKRDAEKRLKAAQSARDDASQRMAFLDKEIGSLQQRLVNDQSSMLQSQEISQPEQEITEALEQKRQEIKVAEDVIAALNLRPGI
ncbi:hypothetical protein K438DRAFT_2011618 [Mycena galopus ATCC 62051]|nr:hypothetical protein K438DRAFT_2011618 [Mycena galopus ATCC 62051]